MTETSAVPWVVVNLIFACLALGIGFVIGAFCFAGKGGSRKRQTENEAEEILEKRIALERALLASGQLHDLAAGVAHDVGDHSQKVQEITRNLQHSEDADGNINQKELTLAMGKLLEANEKLQTRLANAERQIKAQAVEIAAHENEARTDSLTGLSNRRAFDDELGRRFAEWQRKETPFSLAILDVDHFKKFNDTHGHQTGDDVLRKVADAIRASTREMDIPCRYGGEEFAVVLPTTKLGDAGLTAERIRKSIAAQVVDHEGQMLSVTASLGVAEVQSGDDAKLLLRRADEALYEAKDSGRNRVYANANGGNSPYAPESNDSAPETTRKRKPAMLKMLDKLPNRTIFVNLLSNRLAESHRTGQDLSVVTMQVEGYARMKQEHNEDIAALTLDSLAQFLTRTMREMDTLARIAEDRFAVLLPGADVASAQMIAERAGNALSNCTIPIGDEHLQLDARFSYTACQSNDNAARMLERAEVALRSAAPSEVEVL